MRGSGEGSIGARFTIDPDSRGHSWVVEDIDGNRAQGPYDDMAVSVREGSAANRAGVAAGVYKLSLDHGSTWSVQHPYRATLADTLDLLSGIRRRSEG